MKKIGNIINKAEEWILVFLMSALSVIVFAQVVFRYAGHSLSWSEELARYLTIWISFIGASYGFRYGAHIGVEAFKNWLPFRARRVVDLIACIAVAVISVLMMYYGYLIITKVHLKFGQVSPAMRMPMQYAYLAIPVGYLLMIYRNIQNAVFYIREIIRGESIHRAEDDEEGGILL